MNDYPKKFNSSDISVSDKKVIADFHVRRRIFDDYIQKEDLKVFTCPSCGYPTLSERGGYEICTICNWEDDNQDDDTADEIWGGPNSNLSLTESRLNIGGDLEKIAIGLKGALNLLPKEVFQIIKDRDRSIENFLRKNITMTTDFSDPIWNNYSRLKKETLEFLVSK